MKASANLPDPKPAIGVPAYAEHVAGLRVVATAEALRAEISAARRLGKSIGLVPTMGALHAGHLSLVERSIGECDLTVVSIFVNPMQFGPHEDLARYPRDLEADLRALSPYPVELVFAPAVEAVYPPGCVTAVDIGPITEKWEGASRPGHFRGVATVVLKLFNLVQPDVAFFGQKDYQQTVVVRRMVADLDVPVVIRVCPTVREPDGLALSSRNVYLNAEERRRALGLSRSLRQAEELIGGGQRDAAAVRQAVKGALTGVQVDYVAVADPETLEELQEISGPALIAVAARVGTTRLIDNVIVTPLVGEHG
jgi:pantoate--beta-alanine ligase